MKGECENHCEKEGMTVEKNKGFEKEDGEEREEKRREERWKGE